MQAKTSWTQEEVEQLLNDQLVHLNNQRQQEAFSEAEVQEALQQQAADLRAQGKLTPLGVLDLGNPVEVEEQPVVDETPVRMVRVHGWRVRVPDFTIGFLNQAIRDMRDGLDERTEFEFWRDTIISIQDERGRDKDFFDLNPDEAGAIIESIVSYNPNGRRRSR